MEEPTFERAATLLKAVSHPLRLRILSMLLREERCVSAIQERLPVTQPNLSQHLAALRSVGLLGFLQDGQKRCYYLTDRDLVSRLVDLTAHWSGSEPKALAKKTGESQIQTNR